MRLTFGFYDDFCVGGTWEQLANKTRQIPWKTLTEHADKSETGQQQSVSALSPERQVAGSNPTRRTSPLHRTHHEERNLCATRAELFDLNVKNLDLEDARTLLRQAENNA